MGTLVRLPFTVPAIHEIIDSHNGDLKGITSAVDIEKNAALEALKAFKNEMKTICFTMLKNFNVKGHSIEEKEKSLQQKIIDLQGRTSFLNGKELYKHTIRGIVQAHPFSLKVQKQYEAFLIKLVTETLTENAQVQKILNKQGKLLITDITPDMLAEAFWKAWGVKGMGVVTKKSGKRTKEIRGKGWKQGSTIAMQTSTFFEDLKPTFRAVILKELDAMSKDTGLNNLVDTKLDIKVTNNTLNSILNLKSKKDTSGESRLTIEELQIVDKNIVSKVKNLLSKNIKSSFNGKYKSKFDEAVDEVLNQANPQDIFAGKNAANKITGLLGEIQALFYMKVLLTKDAAATWTATDTSQKGWQPHSDLVIRSTLDKVEKFYGIQVKNTTKEEMQDIAFQSFSGALKQLNGDNLLQGSTGKILSENLLKTTFDDFKFLDEHSELFQYALNLLAIQDFNIPYVYANGQRVPGENEKFASTKKRIDSYADLALIALQFFMIGNMYMQIKDSLNASMGQQSNSLYIIGGSLVLTSYSIISDLITRIEQYLQGHTETALPGSMKVSIKQTTKNQDNSTSLTSHATILDHDKAIDNNAQYVNYEVSFQSYYNFLKKIQG